MGSSHSVNPNAGKTGSPFTTIPGHVAIPFIPENAANIPGSGVQPGQFPPDAPAAGSGPQPIKSGPQPIKL